MESSCKMCEEDALLDKVACHIFVVCGIGCTMVLAPELGKSATDEREERRPRLSKPGKNILEQWNGQEAVERYRFSRRTRDRNGEND